MFKLLTEEEKYKVAHEYAVRRVIVVLFALVLVVAVGIIGLLPSYVLSNARYNEAFERTKNLNNSEERKNELKLQSWLEETNSKLKVLSPVLDTDRPSDFLERVLGQKITGISITGFSWLKVRNKITLSVSGVALDRQTLVVFKNRINSSGHFLEVTLPISNLAKDKNIDFQLKFSPL